MCLLWGVTNSAGRLKGSEVVHSLTLKNGIATTCHDITVILP